MPQLQHWIELEHDETCTTTISEIQGTNNSTWLPEVSFPPFLKKHIVNNGSHDELVNNSADHKKSIHSEHSKPAQAVQLL